MIIVKSIVKACKVLELFSSYDTSLKLGEIAQLLDMDGATTNRIVSTLVMQGFLKQTKKRGKYSLGIRFLELGGSISGENKNGDGVIPYLMAFGKLINETIHLSFWTGSNILFSKAQCYFEESFKKNPIDWKSTPLNCTAEGKLILSSMSDEDLKKYFRSKPLEKSTPNTIDDIDRMKEHLVSVKREGIAFEIGERDSEVNSIAAGIKDRNSENIGALVVFGPSIRLTPDILNRITPSIKLCALKISQELGYRS